MNLNQPLRAALIAAALLPAAAVWAEDTPSNMGPASSGSKAAADPLRAVRDAIAAQQWPKALELLKAQQPQLNRNADLHNLLGYVHRKQARPDLDKALEHYRLALEINPGHRGAHEYIGEAYLMRKQPDKAREHLETLKRLCGGTACEEYQDLAEAVAAYRD
jgi:tetratricopeptide (TPR) repeat protein